MAGQPVGSMAEARAAIERILTQNIVPFWFARLRETDGRGYRLHHDASGDWKGPAPKRLVKQARVLWFLSRLEQTGRTPPGGAALATDGLAFLRQRLWDAEHGGFYWEVDDRGERATIDEKHIYGHAFALYAVAEYAITTGEPAARAFADEIFDLLEQRFHDDDFGGYHEFFGRDWTGYPDGKIGCLHAPPGLKLMNSHLHLLEAMIVYDRLSGTAAARRRLLELIDILGHFVVREPEGVCTDEFRRDWVPLRGARHDRVSYGHDLENIHMLVAAHERAGLPNDKPLELYRRLFENAFRFGHDRREGGLFAAGRIGAAADDLRKIWWVQAEAVLAALELHRLTREPAYAERFIGLVDWIVRRQADWEHGDWHVEIVPDGSARGDKADTWKGPYHHGRAMIDALEILDRLA